MAGEFLLRSKGFTIQLTDDNDLWCLEREKVNKMKRNDVLLLGASRMLNAFDIDVFEARYPRRKIANLAGAGAKSTLPVFEDIVNNTSFSGLILIDEPPEYLVVSETPQEEFIRYYYEEYSWKRYIYRNIKNIFQSRFVIFGNSVNIKNYLAMALREKRVPAPNFHEIRLDRSYITTFEKTDYNKLRIYRMSQVRNWIKNGEVLPHENWCYAINSRWGELCRRFMQRGGLPVFIMMPVSAERWELESTKMPKKLYWDQIEDVLGVPTIHFKDYLELDGFRLPDTSHLPDTEREAFTENLLDVVDSIEKKQTVFSKNANSTTSKSLAAEPQA